MKHVIYVEVNEELTDKEILNLHNFIKANPKVENSFSMRDSTERRLDELCPVKDGMVSLSVFDVIKLQELKLDAEETLEDLRKPYCGGQVMSAVWRRRGMIFILEKILGLPHKDITMEELQEGLHNL